MLRESLPPSGAPSTSVMRYTSRGPGKRVERPPAQEPLVYMPALPATADEAMGKVPLAPDCTATRVTGARQGGWEEVDVADGVG